MLLKKIILCLAMCIGLTGLAGAAHYAAVKGTDSIVLDDQAACAADVLQLAAAKGAPPELLAGFRGFTATIDGVQYTGCWVPVESIIVLLYPDGDVGQISQSKFHKLKEA